MLLQNVPNGLLPGICRLLCRLTRRRHWALRTPMSSIQCEHYGESVSRSRLVESSHTRSALRLGPNDQTQSGGPSRSTADTPHHFPYFGGESGAGANDSKQLVGPPECRPKSKPLVWNIDLPLPSGGVHFKSAVPQNAKAIVDKLQRRIHLMHHFDDILIQCCRERQNVGNDCTTSRPETE